MLICLQRYFPYQHPTNPLNLIVPFQALHDSSSSLKSERQSRMWQSSLIDAKPMHHCLAVPIKTGSLPFSFTTGIAHACLYVVSCPGEMACSRAETRAQGRSCMMTTKSLCALGIKSTNAASLLLLCSPGEVKWHHRMSTCDLPLHKQHSCPWFWLWFWGLLWHSR